MTDERKFHVGQRVRATIDLPGDRGTVRAGCEGMITNVYTIEGEDYDARFDGWSGLWVVRVDEIEPVAPDAPARVPSRFATCSHGEDPANCSECTPHDASEPTGNQDLQDAIAFESLRKLQRLIAGEQPAASDAPAEPMPLWEEYLNRAKLAEAEVERLTRERDEARAEVKRLRAALVEKQKNSDYWRQKTAKVQTNYDREQQRVRELHSALEPFAAVSQMMHGGWDETMKIPPFVAASIKVGDIRRAARSAASGEGETE